MKEMVVVTLTSYGKRLINLPVVLDTIFNQTVQPDLVVLNLAFGESVPEDVVEYLKQHRVEVNRVPDTKVYKKIIPTLLKYPNACVINIDDDCMYPHGMIEEFMEIHQKYPEFPISGNRVLLLGMQCHCGCASLLKAEYLGQYISMFDEDLMQHCSSSDIVYTFFATKNNHPYIRSRSLYFDNMVQPELEGHSYSKDVVNPQDGIGDSFNYLTNRFGKVLFDLRRYFPDECLSEVVCPLEEMDLEEKLLKKEFEVEKKIRSTSAYRIGRLLLRPLNLMRRLLQKE